MNKRLLITILFFVFILFVGCSADKCGCSNGDVCSHGEYTGACQCGCDGCQCPVRIKRTIGNATVVATHSPSFKQGDTLCIEVTPDFYDTSFVRFDILIDSADYSPVDDASYSVLPATYKYSFSPSQTGMYIVRGAYSYFNNGILYKSTCFILPQLTVSK